MASPTPDYCFEKLSSSKSAGGSLPFKLFTGADTVPRLVGTAEPGDFYQPPEALSAFLYYYGADRLWHSFSLNDCLEAPILHPLQRQYCIGRHKRKNLSPTWILVSTFTTQLGRRNRPISAAPERPEKRARVEQATEADALHESLIRPSLCSDGGAHLPNAAATHGRPFYRGVEADGSASMSDAARTRRPEDWHARTKPGFSASAETFTLVHEDGYCGNYPEYDDSLPVEERQTGVRAVSTLSSLKLTSHAVAATVHAGKDVQCSTTVVERG